MVGTAVGQPGGASGVHVGSGVGGGVGNGGGVSVGSGAGMATGVTCTTAAGGRYKAPAPTGEPSGTQLASAIKRALTPAAAASCSSDSPGPGA